MVNPSDPARRVKLLAETSVAEVWGVDRRLSAQPAEQEITTVADLAGTDAQAQRKRFSMALEKTARELRNIACLMRQT